MSPPLPPHSHRRVHARLVGEELRRLLVKQHVSKRGLAATIGTSRSLLTLWCKGEVLPTIDLARKLAEALVAPSVVELVREARIRTCPIDGTEFEERGGRPSIFCSVDCSKKGSAQNQRRRRAISIPMLEAERDLLRNAVGSFCHSCEWDGICKDPDCELRAVSPLPLGEAIAVDRAEPWHQGPLTAEGRERIAAANRERWARPGARERHGQTIAIAHPANDPERRSAFRASVSAGRRTSA